MARPCGRGAGGIAGLVALIEQHGGALEADLRHYYQRGLRDLAEGRVTWRELLAYVRHLPATCQVAAEIHGDAAAWSATDRLLADVFDVLAMANWQRGGNKNAPRPKPYPRPRSKQETAALGRRLKKLARRGRDG